MGGPSDEGLIHVLLAQGAPQAALRMAWRRIEANNDEFSWLTLHDYELIAVLGQQADLLAYADTVEARMARFLNAKPSNRHDGHRGTTSLPFPDNGLRELILQAELGPRRDLRAYQVCLALSTILY